MAEGKLAELLNGFEEAGAEAEVRRLGLFALPVFRSAFKKLSPHESIKAQWYCALIQNIQGDIFQEICDIADILPYGMGLELGWLLRHPRYAGKGEAALRELENRLDLQKNADGLSLSDYRFAAVLVELLGRSRETRAIPLLEKILELQLAAHDPRKKQSFLVSGENDLSASLATTFLLFAEMDQAIAYKSEVLEKIAAAAFLRGKENSINGPLPLLFLPLKDSGRHILEKIAGGLSPVDPLLSDLFYYFKTAEKMQLEDLPSRAGLKPLRWLELLEKGCDRKSYGPGCALFLRKAIDPGSAQEEAIRKLVLPFRSADDLSLILQGLDIGSCDQRALPFLCEIKFYFGDPGASTSWAAMNGRLTALGLDAVKDWLWSPDLDALGRKGGEPLTGLMDAYECVAAQRASFDQEPDAGPAVINLLRNRLLWSRSGQEGKAGEALRNFIYSVSGKGLLGALYAQSLRIIGKKEWMAILWLGHPRIDEDYPFAGELVEMACRFESQPMKDAMVDFAFRAGWGSGKGDYGIWNKITLYFARVAERRAIPALVPPKGSSTLGSAFEIAIVNLGERYPEDIDDASFRNAFMHLLEDGYADFSWLFFEARSMACLCSLAASDDEEKISLSANGVSRLVDSRKAGLRLPVELLIQYLMKIDDAVARAKQDPGETWEDRNWGGYTMSDSERYADTLSEAIRRLLKRKYSVAELERLRSALPSSLLSQLVLIESSSFSIEYANVNLCASLGLG